MKPWLYKNKEVTKVEDFNEPNLFGFIYRIDNLKTGQYYVGKKFIIHNTKRKIGKKEKALIEGKGRRPNFERVKKESDWKTYFSSSEIIKEDVKQNGTDHYKREIIQLAFSKKHLSYLEIKLQFQLDVLVDPLSLNDNINGRYFKKDFEEDLAVD
jgi:hypothetical protein